LAAITATTWDVTSALTGTGITMADVKIHHKLKYTDAVITLSVSGSYPSGLAGIPLPTGAWGFVRNVSYYILVGPTSMTTANAAMSVTGVVFSMSTANTILAFSAGVGSTAALLQPLATSETLGSGLSLRLTAVGW